MIGMGNSFNKGLSIRHAVELLPTWHYPECSNYIAAWCLTRTTHFWTWHLARERQTFYEHSRERDVTKDVTANEHRISNDVIQRPFTVEKIYWWLSHRKYSFQIFNILCTLKIPLILFCWTFDKYVSHIFDRILETYKKQCFCEE